MIGSHALASTLALAACTALAPAQGVVTYYWDINATGSHVAEIAPGETAQLMLYATWTPHEGIVGIAGTIYDIVALENWTSGEIVSYTRHLYDLLDYQYFDENNEMLGIEAFQLPPAFNPDFDASRPIPLFELTWVPHDYTPRTVRMTDANHLNNDLYTDEFGSSVGYDQAPSLGATIHIVPAPPSLLVCVLMLRARRRR